MDEYVRVRARYGNVFVCVCTKASVGSSAFQMIDIEEQWRYICLPQSACNIVRVDASMRRCILLLVVARAKRGFALFRSGVEAQVHERHAGAREVR